MQVFQHLLMTCRLHPYDHTPMNASESRRMAALEALVRRQAAEIGQLKDSLHRLTHAHAVVVIERDEARAALASQGHELSAVRAELDQSRQQHADTKRQLGDLVNALAHSDERLRALVRREFVASSERMIADNTYIPEILAALREQEQETTVALTPETADVASATQGVVATEAPGTTTAAAATIPAPERRKRKRPANAGGRNPLPDDIERRHSTYVPPADHPALRNAVSFDAIGETTIELWHIGKLDLHIKVIHCPVVKLTLQDNITTQQTLSPPMVIERSQVSDTLLVQSAIDKVVDHLPAYRQEQRAERLGIYIPRSKLCRWHIALAQFLDGVADAVFDEIVANPVIGIDDSVHRRLVSGRHVCQKARIWAVTGPAGTFYMYSPTREGRWINDLLEDYSGGIMGDAYAGHRALLSREDIVTLFCWAHVRRKFYDSVDRERRSVMLALIAELYAIEDEIATWTPQQREFARAARAEPVLLRIKGQLDAWHVDPRVLPKSGIGRAVTYALKLWSGLKAYVSIGTAPVDNNATERAMRRVAMHRKNSLFSASDAGAQGYATLLTLSQSAMDHKLDPIAYLCDIIEDIHYSRHPLSALTPQSYARRKRSLGEKPS
jgi:transposase